MIPDALRTSDRTPGSGRELRAARTREPTDRVSRSTERVPPDPIPPDPSPDAPRPSAPPDGRSLVTRRAIVDLVRSAVRTSYGVSGVDDGGPLDRVLVVLGLRDPAIAVHVDGRLEVDLRLTVAYGLPVAEVARQVDSAVRYTVRRALRREIDRLTIHVGGLDYEPASIPPPAGLG